MVWRLRGVRAACARRKRGAGHTLRGTGKGGATCLGAWSWRGGCKGHLADRLWGRGLLPGDFIVSGDEGPESHAERRGEHNEKADYSQRHRRVTIWIVLLAEDDLLFRAHALRKGSYSLRLAEHRAAAVDRVRHAWRRQRNSPT